MSGGNSSGGGEAVKPGDLRKGDVITRGGVDYTIERNSKETHRMASGSKVRHEVHLRATDGTVTIENVSPGKKMGVMKQKYVQPPYDPKAPRYI